MGANISETFIDDYFDGFLAVMKSFLLSEENSNNLQKVAN
jgi:hypothetical protein